jgi:hypothetical protein
MRTKYPPFSASEKIEPSPAGTAPALSVSAERDICARTHPSDGVPPTCARQLLPLVSCLRSTIATVGLACVLRSASVVSPSAPSDAEAVAPEDVALEPPHGRRSFSLVYPERFGHSRGDGVGGLRHPAVQADVVLVVAPESAPVVETLTVFDPSDADAVPAAGEESECVS